MSILVFFFKDYHRCLFSMKEKHNSVSFLLCRAVFECYNQDKAKLCIEPPFSSGVQLGYGRRRLQSFADYVGSFRVTTPKDRWTHVGRQTEDKSL